MGPTYCADLWIALLRKRNCFITRALGEEPSRGLGRATDCSLDLQVESSRWRLHGKKMPGTDFAVKPLAKWVLFWHGHTWPQVTWITALSRAKQVCRAFPCLLLSKLTLGVSRGAGTSLQFPLFCPQCTSTHGGALYKTSNTQRSRPSPPHHYNRGNQGKRPKSQSGHYVSKGTLPSPLMIS